MTDALDGRLMAAAIRLGAGALGSTWPNPAVGAIVVRDGRVVGRGRTAVGGRPHGEPIALAQAGERARGATLYVSLEPCSHHGKTPPCTDAIIASGIARVVAASIDPEPRVAGNGFAKLSGAGIRVDSGTLAASADRMHAGHRRRVADGRPHVTLKLAVSADDAIGRRGAARAAVTGARALRYAQALRARADAILVGRGTVEADDPELTCRLPGLEGRSPVRVILDSKAALTRNLKVFSGATPTWIMNERFEDGAVGDRVRRLHAPVAADGGLDLPAVLARLAGEGITRLLVEGGARVARAFLQADLVDEALLFRSTRTLGGNIVPALAGLPLAAIEDSGRFRRTERRSFGPDCMSRYEREV